MKQTRLFRFLIAAVAFVVFTSGLLYAQLPSGGVIQMQYRAFLEALVASANTWTGAQIFDDVTVNGSCTGCGEPDTALQITVDGEFPAPTFVMTGPMAASFDGAVIPAAGPNVVSIDLGEPFDPANNPVFMAAEHLTFDNLTGVLGTITVTDGYATNLEQLRFDALVVVGGRVYIDSSSLTDFFAPALRVVQSQLTINASNNRTVDLRALQSAGDISLASSMENVTDLQLQELAFVARDVNLGTLDAVDDLDLSKLETVGRDMSVNGAAIETISAPLLARVGGGIDISTGASLTALNLSGLDTVGGALALHDGSNVATLMIGPLTSVGEALTLENLNVLPSLDLGALQSVGSDLLLGYSAMTPLMTAIDLGSLETVGGFCEIGIATITSLDVSSLKTVNGYLSVVTAATTLAFPDLETVLGALTLSFVDTPALVTTSIPAMKRIDGDFAAAGMALSQGSVDAILVRLAAMDGTAGTTSYDNHAIVLDGGTNAAPGALGLAAITVLEGRGNTVMTN